jgi:hypothetical protein
VQQPDAAEVGRALDRVFARREFTTGELPGLLQLLRDTWDAFRSWVSSQLLRMLPDSVPPALGWLVLGLLVLLAAWSLAVLVRGELARRRPRREAAVGAVPAVPGPRHAAAWEAAARDAAAAGRFRDAALALYVATVLRLEERGAVRYHSGKTPGDYRGEAKADPTTGPRFDLFIGQLLPMAYGPRSPDANSFDSLRRAAMELGVHA